MQKTFAFIVDLSIYYKRSFFSVVIRWKSPSLIWQGAFFLPVVFSSGSFLVAVFLLIDLPAESFALHVFLPKYLMRRNTHAS